MSRPPRVPRYRRHKQSGQAIVTLTDGVGRRRDLLLGKHGTAASRHEYARVIGEWEAGGRILAPTMAEEGGLSVNELILQFMRHAEQHYRRADGTATNELSDFRYSLRPLKELYGHTEAEKFGPLRLRAVRTQMINGGLCRGVINQRVGRIRRMFRWAVEHELVTPHVLQALQAVKWLERNRSKARETQPVKPVPEAWVRAVLPHVRPQVAAMIQLQLATGMRPGEVCIMRAIDLDMTGKVWIYRPSSHKMEYRGGERVVAIGPRGQEIIRPFLKPNVEAFLFSPREAVTEWQAEKRACRKTRVQPSQMNRRKRRPKHRPGDRYTTSSYYTAIRRGCDLAFPPPENLRQQEGETKAAWTARLTDDEKAELRDWRRAHRWHPNRLRHTAATLIRREADLDTARTVLGHRSVTVTQVYAEKDLESAVAVMGKIG
jgi:integrase